MSSNLRFILAAALLAGTALFLQARRGQEVILARQDFDSFPRQLGNWAGSDAPISQQVRDILGPGDFLSRTYENSSARVPAVNLFVAYFPSQRAGDTIHSPKHCLPGSGWLPLESQRMLVSLPGHAPIPANRYIVAKAGERQLVLYWYWAHGRAIASEYSAKFYLVADSMTMNRSDGSLVRMITPLRSGETAEAGQQRLLAFAAEVLPLMDTYVPR